jgi:UDP-MurNAc hydroxylase
MTREFKPVEIRLVSHASVTIECVDAFIWTDPWLFGKVFNDSWTLCPNPVFDDSQLQRVTHLWISHEHPDHFHLPTLDSLPCGFKERVVVLVQDKCARKVFASLRKVGFRNFVALKHRKQVPISAAVSVYCYQVGTLDSCLAVIEAGRAILDANDARINATDCRLIVKEVGPIDVLLSQFSLAVTSGDTDEEKSLSRAARHVVESLHSNHRDLEAKVTIPFASLIYWSAIDNRRINAFANKPQDVFDFFRRQGAAAAILYPGDTYVVNRPYDSTESLRRYDRLYAGFDALTFDVTPSVPLVEIKDAFLALANHLKAKFPAPLLDLLRPVTVAIPDLGVTIVFSLRKGSFEQIHPPCAPDLSIYSQPLIFCFSHPYGAQTLAISGRFRVFRGARNWRLHRALFALNSAEVYLKPRYLTRLRNWTYLKDRLRAWSRYRDRGRAAERAAETL